jgi:hypothetical protein
MKGKRMLSWVAIEDSVKDNKKPASLDEKRVFVLVAEQFHPYCDIKENCTHPTFLNKNLVAAPRFLWKKVSDARTQSQDRAIQKLDGPVIGCGGPI